jgi:hypothetical protein
MGNDYVQSIALITVFISVASTILSKFLYVILNSRGLMNRWDVFIVVLISWIVFFAVYLFMMDFCAVADSKRPMWNRWLRRVGSITNIVLGVFITFYLSSLIDTVNFQSFGFTEVFTVIVAAIFFLASIQLVFEKYVQWQDVRLNQSGVEKHLS